jgi:hypothetical protein
MHRCLISHACGSNDREEEEPEFSVINMKRCLLFVLKEVL